MQVRGEIKKHIIILIERNFYGLNNFHLLLQCTALVVCLGIVLYLYLIYKI